MDEDGLSQADADVIGNMASWRRAINNTKAQWTTDWHADYTFNGNIVTPKLTPKTSAEFAELDTEKMLKADVVKLLNDALVALEESEAAWEDEHTKRVEAEKTVKDLREAGFTGSVISESEAPAKPEENPFEGPKVVVTGAPSYTGTGVSIQELQEKLSKQLRERRIGP